MILDRVTITGADDSVAPADLVAITQDFPFVEWGILASPGHTAHFSHNAVPRFPSLNWIGQLINACEKSTVDLCLHICGEWTRQILRGEVTLVPLLRHSYFKRMQLNFHRERNPRVDKALHTALLSLGPRQYIFQLDGAVGNKHLEAVYEVNEDFSHFVDAVGLFDKSGGVGVLPDSWPEPVYMDNDIDPAYHGYAGGLGPANLEEQLPLIFKVAGNARIWIDMETHVRSSNDKQFDLAKVRRALEICQPHIMLPFKSTPTVEEPEDDDLPKPGKIWHSTAEHPNAEVSRMIEEHSGK